MIIIPMARRTAAPPGTQRAADKASTHERILESASRLIRRSGFAAASVPAVMRGAGLTIGGFYAHFRSKRAMDAEVLRRTLADVRQGWFDGLEQREGLDWLRRALRRYLSPAHRDAVDTGCAFPATLSELTRADKATRAAMAEAFEAVVRDLAAHAPATAGVSARERALAATALCIGGLTLSRILRDHPASDELLRACVRWALPEDAASRTALTETH